MYAATLATGIDAPSVALLDETPTIAPIAGETRTPRHNRRHMGGRPLCHRRHAARLHDVPGLAALARDFPDVPIRALDQPELRPDERLRKLESIDPTDARQLLDDGAPEDIPAPRRVHDGIAAYLQIRGLPTLDSGGYADSVVAAVRAEIPGIVIKLDDDRTDAVLDMLEESQREVIELHEHALPVQLLMLPEAGTRAADFLRRHDGLGPHVLAVWARADLFARQFTGAGADALRRRDGHVHHQLVRRGRRSGSSRSR